MKALIFCNGSITDYSYYKKACEEAEFIICADGGAIHAHKMGIFPHLLVGDFDSLPADILNYFEKAGIEITRFKVEKDMTDTELAVELARKRGYRDITLVGGLGSRLDHSMANIFLLKRLHDMGIKGTIINETNEITVISDRIELKKEKDLKISLLPLSERVEGVTTKGLYYPLDNATIEMGSTWGISNEFADDRAEVTLKKGIMLVIKARD